MQIFRPSQRCFLLGFTVAICILLITRKSDDYSKYTSDSLNSKTPLFDTKTRGTAYVNLQNLTYSEQSAPPCDFRLPPYLLLLVHSSPDHFIHRSTIRRTWGSIPRILGHNIRVVFLVGETKGRLRKKMHREMKNYQDMVKGNFFDSYKNLTYKHLLGYQWMLSNCKQAAVIMKVDDDVFVEIFRAIHVLTQTFGPRPSNLLAGLVSRWMKVLRNGKWSVPREEYPYGMYPEYLSGFAYFVSPDVARKLYATVETIPFFWIDDVFMTGFVAAAAHVAKTDLSVRFSPNDGFLIGWLLRNSTKPSPWIATEVQHRRWPGDVFRLWSKTVKAWSVT